MDGLDLLILRAVHECDCPGSEHLHQKLRNLAAHSPYRTEVGDGTTLEVVERLHALYRSGHIMPGQSWSQPPYLSLSVRSDAVCLTRSGRKELGTIE